MASILTLEATGPKGEELASRAGDVTNIPVGYDPEFQCATFDADDLEPGELKTVVFEALGNLDPDWQSHLRVAD